MAASKWRHLSKNSRPDRSYGWYTVDFGLNLAIRVLAFAISRWNLLPVQKAITYLNSGWQRCPHYGIISRNSPHIMHSMSITNNTNNDSDAIYQLVKIHKAIYCPPNYTPKSPHQPVPNASHWTGSGGGEGRIMLSRSSGTTGSRPARRTDAIDQ